MAFPLRASTIWVAVAVAVMAAVFESCGSGVTIRPVSIYALSGPDSLIAGRELRVRFSYTAGTFGHLDSYRWRAVDDSTFELLAYYAYERGPTNVSIRPTYETVDTATLPRPPERLFRVRAGNLALVVRGGAGSLGAEQLTVELRDRVGDPMVGVPLRIFEFLDGSTTDIPPTGSAGISVIASICRAGGRLYHVDSPLASRYVVGAYSQWQDRCSGSQRIVMLGADYGESAF